MLTESEWDMARYILALALANTGLWIAANMTLNTASAYQ